MFFLLKGVSDFKQNLKSNTGVYTVILGGEAIVIRPVLQWDFVRCFSGNSVGRVFRTGVRGQTLVCRLQKQVHGFERENTFRTKININHW